MMNDLNVAAAPIIVDNNDEGAARSLRYIYNLSATHRLREIVKEIVNGT